MCYAFKLSREVFKSIFHQSSIGWNYLCVVFWIPTAQLSESDHKFRLCNVLLNFQDNENKVKKKNFSNPSISRIAKKCLHPSKTDNKILAAFTSFCFKNWPTSPKTDYILRKKWSIALKTDLFPKKQIQFSNNWSVPAKSDPIMKRLSLF